MGTIERGVRNVLRSPIRLVLVVVIFGTSLMFFAVMVALNASAQQKLADAKAQIGSGITVRPAGSFGGFGGGGTLTSAQVTTIEKTPGIASATAEITQRYTEDILKGAIAAPTNTGGGNGFGGGGGGFASDNGTIAPTIYGLVPGQSSYSLINGSTAKVVSGKDMTTSDASADVALTSSALATANNLKVGSTFTLNGTTITLVGLISTGSSFGDNTIIIPLATAQKIYSISGVSDVTVYAPSNSGVSALASTLKTELGSGVDVTQQSTVFTATLDALQSAQSNIFTTLVVSGIVAVMVILFAVLMIVRERLHEIGLLKAIGASHLQVVSQFAVEVITMSGIAAVIAALLLAILGGTLASKFDITSASTVTRTFGGGGGGAFRFGGGFPTAAPAQTAFSAGLTPGALLLVLGLGILLAAVASAIPAWYVSRIKPAEVLRSE